MPKRRRRRRRGSDVRELLLIFRALMLTVTALTLIASLAGRKGGVPANTPEPLPPSETETGTDAPEPDPGGTDPEPEPDPKEALITSMIDRMSLEEKVGQMFFVRCPEEGALEKIGRYHIGGYLLFSRDFEGKDAQTVKDMTASYQEKTDIPLLIGADEEGGTVVRLSRNPLLFKEKFKSPQAVFESGGLDAVHKDAAEKSAGLLQYGINVNFAPVADVSTNSKDFIYARSFGQDAAATSEYIKAAVSEMKQAGIGSVLKHFPGYGNNIDTHTGIAIDERPYEQFEKSDFLPFKAGIEAGASSVLVSHNIVKCMDEELPASLSPEVHRILREELGFEGVILTDDLAMDAVEAYAEDGSVAVLAAIAGNDMIVTTDFEDQIPLVIEAVRTGLLSSERVNEAVTRVLSWKYDLGLLGE